MNKIVKNSKSTLVDTIAAMFILLYLYSALYTIYQRDPIQDVLTVLPLFGIPAKVFNWSAIAMEFAVVLLLFFPKTRKAGLIASLGLMILFTAYIVYLLKIVPELPCSCGAIMSQLTLKPHLFLNAVFIILGFVAILMKRKPVKKSEEEPVPVIYT